MSNDEKLHSLDEDNRKLKSEVVMQNNIEFSILNNLTLHNGIEKPICKKHPLKWYLKQTDYATRNAMYVLQLQNSKERSLI